MVAARSAAAATLELQPADHRELEVLPAPRDREDAAAPREREERAEREEAADRIRSRKRGKLASIT
jgi:hypothetical protein